MYKIMDVEVQHLRGGFRMNPTKKEALFKWRIDEVAKMLQERFALDKEDMDLKLFLNVNCYRFLVSKRTMKDILEIAATRVGVKIEGGKITKNGKIQSRIPH